MSNFTMLEQYAAAYRVPIISQEVATCLTSYVQEHRPETILEIGTAIGYSALKMASVLPASNALLVTIERSEEMFREAVKNFSASSSHVQVLLQESGEAGSEASEEGAFFREALLFSLHNGVRVLSVLADALLFLPTLVRSTREEGERRISDLFPENYDFIFVDASKGHYGEYFAYAKSLLSKEGIVFFDNVDFKGLVESSGEIPKRSRTIVKRMREFREAIRAEHDFETEFFKIGDGIAVSRRKWM